MNLVQITPGAGGMYCGGCLRDNALVTELRRAGHEVTMVPLYLPLTLDESNQSAGTPIFFGGINVYLDQKSALFRRAPRWVHRLLAAPGLLKRAAGHAAKTRPEELGELTLSMLRGEDGKQSGELVELIAWLKTQPRPHAILLSNSLLAGMIRRMRTELECPVVCMLQGEDWFLDSLPESHRKACWKAVAERVRDADGLVAPSRYYADLMARRLRADPNSIQVVYNGINLDGFPAAEKPMSARPQSGAVLGYFARMCREKGLDVLVEAYIKLRQGGLKSPLKLKIGGSCGPADEPFVEQLRGRLEAAGLRQDVEFHPNLARGAKIAFYESLSVFSVPAAYGEAFGLYVIEALAAGVPVVQPCSGAFPELLRETGGGLLCEPNDPQSLADVLAELLEAPGHGRELARRGQQSVAQKFTAAEMAKGIIRVCEGGIERHFRR